MGALKFEHTCPCKYSFSVVVKEMSCFDSLCECLGARTYCKTQTAVEFDWRTAAATQNSIWYVNVHCISWKILRFYHTENLKIKSSLSVIYNEWYLDLLVRSAEGDFVLSHFQLLAASFVKMKITIYSHWEAVNNHLSFSSLIKNVLTL